MNYSIVLPLLYSGISYKVQSFLLLTGRCIPYRSVELARMYHSNAARMIPDDTVVQMEYVCAVSCNLLCMVDSDGGVVRRVV